MTLRADSKQLDKKAFAEQPIHHSMFNVRCSMFIFLFFIFILSLFQSPSFSIAASNDDAITITTDDITAMNAGKMPDVLNHIPGVTAGDSSVSIHGSSKVRVFVDGRPINDVTSSHGGVNWDLVAPDDVEKVVVLRGKGGITHGEDSSGGVILITSKRIRKLTGHIKSYAGSDNTVYSRGDLTMTSGILGLGLTGGFEKTDGYKINNDKERKQIGGKLSFLADEKKSLAFYADYLEDDRGLAGLPDYPTPCSRKTTRTTVLSAQGRYNETTAGCSYSQGENHNSDISKNLDQTLEVSELGQDIRSAVTTGSFGELAFGAAYKLAKAEGTTFDDQEEKTASLFACQSLGVKESPFSLSLGVRASSNSEFDESYNPEAKAVFKKERWRFTGTFSRTNNTPSFYQRYSHTSSTIPNPDLGMETADNVCLALFVSPFPVLSGSVSVFHNILTDRITYETGDDGMGQYQNFGEVTYTGFDLALDLKPHRAVNVKGSYTYLEAKDEETGFAIPAKADNQGTFDVYLKPFDHLNLSVKTKAVSRVYRNKANTKTVPGYATTDVYGEYSFGRFSLFTEIENVFDKTYFYADGLLGPGLTWKIGGELKI